jgi:PhnB protein
MKAIQPYLNFAGNTEEAFGFYRSVFGGEFATLLRYSESPMAENVPAADRNKIMHMCLPLPNGTLLMGTDTYAGQPLTVGNNMHLYLDTDSEAEASALFSKLSAGGKVEMPVQKTFWGAFFGICADRFGVQWMVNYAYPRA